MRRSSLIFTALLACAGSAAAQPTELVYESAFSGYKKYDEPKVADWKATNAAIAATAGHAGHGAHGTKNKNTQSATDEHAGHDMKQAQDEHAGHDMTKMQQSPVAKPAALVPAKPLAKAKTNAAADPHAGHNH